MSRERKIVIYATGSSLRPAALERALGNDHVVVGVNPELVAGEPESDNGRVVEVASEKVDKVRANWERVCPQVQAVYPELSDGSDALVYGVDVAVVVNGADLRKLGRSLGVDDRDGLETARAQAQQLYCNGHVFVLWQVGMVVAKGDKERQAWVEVGGIYPAGVIDEEDVHQAFANEECLSRGPRLPLAELARGKEGVKFFGRNRGEMIWESLDPAEVEDLVVGGVPPGLALPTLMAFGDEETVMVKLPLGK